jgi:hypothetical protein
MSSERKFKDRAEVEAHLAAGGSLRGCDLSGVDLQGLDLSNQDLTTSRLRYAELSGCNLRGAILRGANLRHARLLGADLRYADLSMADLGEADLHGVLLGETRTDGAKADKAQGVSSRVFFPRSLLNRLLQRGARRQGDELLIDGPPPERFQLVEACRVLEADGTVRGPTMVGKVFAVAEMAERGGEVGEGFLLLDGTSWRVEDGWLGTPLTEAAATPAANPADTGSKTDTTMLEDFLLGKLT